MPLELSVTGAVHDRTPGWLRWTTRISIVIGGVALAITVHDVGIETLVGHLEAIGGWFLALLALEAASTLCEAGAVYLVVRTTEGPSFRAVCVAQVAGRAVNSVTPGGNLGEALKVSLLARECRPQRAVAAVLFVALGGVIVLLGVIAAGTLVTALAFEMPAQVIAVLSAGVLVQWMCSWVPLGIGVAEGGNCALFAAIGAPAALGVALALARRVNQIVFAAIGFGVLAADRLPPHLEVPAEVPG